MIDTDSVWKDIETIRERAPLVHNITNYVVMNTTANALLALGASPVMAHASEEVEDMVGIAGALVINIGTLSGPWIKAMGKAAHAAKVRNIPIIFDPVGAGATALRTDTSLALIQADRPAVIRGNASEIRALYSAEQETKGVDSRHSSEDALEAAQQLSEQLDTVVSVSGEVDVIVSGSQVIRTANGHPMMPRVTGLGCTASALTGAFAAVNTDTLLAAAHAMAVMGIGAEMAADKSSGPASLQMHFIDALHLMQEEDIRGRLRIIS